MTEVAKVANMSDRSLAIGKCVACGRVLLLTNAGVRSGYETTVLAQLVDYFTMLFHVVCRRICCGLVCPHEKVLLQTRYISQFTVVWEQFTH